MVAKPEQFCNVVRSVRFPGPPARAPASAEPKVPGGHGVVGAADPVGRRVPRPAGRGQELPAAAAGAAAHAGAEDEAQEAHAPR